MDFVKHLNIDGADTKEIPCIVGKVDPTEATLGAVGCFYLNEDTGDLFKCLSAVSGVYKWERINSGDLYSQGRSVKYSFSSGGWKRVLNIIRVSGGIVTFGLAQTSPKYMSNAVGICFSGFVKYKNDSSTDKRPVLYQLYNNTFGEDDALSDATPARITQVRIAYPKQGTTFPNSDGAIKDYSVNPVNCYLEVYVDFNPKNANTGECAFNMNYAGFADSHNCVPITEETPALGIGMYGEALSYEYLTLSEDGGMYLPKDTLEAETIKSKNIYANGDEVWSGKEIVDKMCPEFKEVYASELTTCEPVEEYPLNVSTSLNDVPCTRAVVNHTGKNMFPLKLKTKTSNGVAFTHDPDTGSVRVSGTSSTATIGHTERFILPPGTYTVSAGYTGNPNCYIQVRNEETDTTLATQIGYKYESRTFTLYDFTKIHIRFYVKGGVYVRQTMYPMLELGNYATNFEPYRGVRYEVDFGREFSECEEFNWNTGILKYRVFDTDILDYFVYEEYFNKHSFPAFPGINILYTERWDEYVSVSGRSDLKAELEKMKNAIISLGGKI